MRKPPVPNTPPSPAAKVIAAFGGPRALASAINRNVAQIYRWTYPASRGGTAGKIPGSALHDVLDAAKERGIKLTADDLLGLRGSRREAA